MEAGKKEAEVLNLDPIKQCAQEIDVILAKYNCQLIAEREIIFGQPVFVPKVAPLQK